MDLTSDWQPEGLPASTVALVKTDNSPTSIRIAARKNGYRPVPISGIHMSVKHPGKQPVLANWQQRCANADEKTIRSWSAHAPDCTNTGMLTGISGGIVAADIDVLIPKVAAEIADLASDLLGATPLQRIGRAPKTLYVYRVASDFRKVKTPTFVMPDGSDAAVEFLAEGQQFVAFGQHPTGKPYQWVSQSPADVPVDELPLVDLDAVEAFVDCAAQVLRHHGGVPKQANGKTKSVTVTTSKATNGSVAPVGDNYFANVNSAALANLEPWVRPLFSSNARLHPGTGAYRIRSEDLGRDLEEDISIHPDGAWDFGLEKPISPIDLVIEHGGAADAVQSAHWLCEKLRIDPVSLGWSETKPKTQKAEPAGGDIAEEIAPETAPALASFLCADTWTERELEVPEPLMGEVITNTTRLFIGGPTGIGKTNIGMAMAGGLSTGDGFLHWRSSRPCKVLYIDGEMARDLVQERLRDLKRRMGVQDLPNLFVLCREDSEEVAKRFGIGEVQPLNTPAGQAFILKVIDMIGDVDVVVFDNRMSLLDGDMKDEVPWTQTMPLVKTITSKRIGQVWFDHTGNDTTRLYGTKTKEWQFDSVAILEKVDRPDTDVSFAITFTKARRRKPSNRADFEQVTVALVDDAWTVNGEKPTVAKTAKPPSPKGQAFYKRLCNAINNKGAKDATVTKTLWRDHCKGDLLHMQIDKDGNEKPVLEVSSRTLFNKHITELTAHGWIRVNGELVTALHNGNRQQP
jgi:hypothetical protein